MEKLPPLPLKGAATALLAAVVAACGGPPPPAADAYPHAYDLAVHAPDALPRRETRLVDFGTPESHAHTRRGWTGDDVFADDGSTFAWSLGEGSEIELTVLEPRRLEAEARLRPYRIDGPPQHLALALNGHDVALLTLKGGMRTYRFTLPAEALRRGTNVLAATNVYPEDVPPGPPDLGPPGVAWDFLDLGGDPVAFPEGGGETLTIPFGSETSYLVELGGPSVLWLDRLESSRFRGRLAVRLRAAGEDGDRLETELAPSRRARALELDADFPAFVRLTLTAPGPGGDGEAIVLHRPRILSRAEVLDEPLRSGLFAPPATTVEAGTVEPPRAETSRDGGPNVVVYLVDTLRADRLGCYGHDGETSPALDAFAQGAVLFENATAQTSWTRSAVASLLTGRGPRSHGVWDRGDALSEDALTLAEVLRRAGWDTAAFVTNGNADSSVGLGQGFDVFELLDEEDTRALHASAAEVNRAAFAWLASRSSERPFFLWLHTMEPHAPYAPPPRLTPGVDRGGAAWKAALEPTERHALGHLREDLERRFGRSTSRLELGSVAWMHGLAEGLLPVDPVMTESLLALYDAEVGESDHHFGVLLDGLRSAGLYDDTIVVFVSDHGEEFADHGGWEHGRTLYEEQLRVPLVIRLPGGPRGVRVASGGRQVDLLPTLVDVLGLESPPGVEGESLLPRMTDGSPAPPSYAHLRLDGRAAESLTEGRFKLLCGGSASGTGGGCRLFDLRSDPRETRDLSAERPVVASYLERRLRAFRHPEAPLEAEPAEIDEALRERLRALGYLR